NPDGRKDYCAPKTFKGTASKLFRNLGTKAGKKAGTAPMPEFKDVSDEARVLKPGPGLGVIAADFTGDGWPDIFVANDGLPNHLWVNQRNGTFKEEAATRGVAVNAMGVAEANMGIGWGDLDGDGLPDVFVTHLDNETNTVWKQGPVGFFKDWTVKAKMHRPRWRATGFGTVLADFDNDGHLDAAIVNGAVTKAKSDPESPLGPFWSQYAQRNQVFANDGTGRFKDVSPSTPDFCGYGNVGRTLAMGDLDNSGSVWLVAVQIAGPLKVLRNTAPDKGGWLRVRCLLPLAGGKTRDALGADVWVKHGKRTQTRTIQTNGGYLTSNDPRAHFGLGDAKKADSVEVRWPDGKRERFAGREANGELVLVQGKGEAVR
ncbi:MAG: CRTAC1 family protein, partial [Gemmataceae bacterium]|nr:CRTAC1 family protein [Gemmataceae bacterium]